MKKIIATLMAIIIALSFVYGQTINATTENGKKVILNSDGTWKYAEEEKSTQVILNPNDCSNWITTEVDEVTGNSFTGIKDYLIVSHDGGKNGFGINIFKSPKSSIIISIKAVGAGSCIDEGDKINILFTDGSRLELASEGSFNCKGNATIYFGGMFRKKSQLNELKTKKIDLMRVWTSDSYVEEQFDSEQADQIINALNCLTK